jgi:Uncharacterized conserved protein
MKPAIVFVATFVISAGASTGAKVMMTKPSHAAAADSTKIGVDTTATDSAARSHEKPAADTARKQPAPAPRVAIPAESTGAPVATPPKAKTAAAAMKTPATPAPAVAPPAADSVVGASERRLAKVFTAMEAKQAAKVLQHMEDGDVQIILGYVGPRQAASILAELPPERVATLSKRAMQVKTK